MFIHSILLILFNLIIYALSKEINCNNSLQLFTPKSYIDLYYSKKLRFLDKQSNFIDDFLNLLDLKIFGIKKAVLLARKDILEKVENVLDNEIYSTNIYNLLDEFINEKNVYFCNIMDTIEKNREKIKNKVKKIESKENFKELLSILLEYKTIAENLRLFTQEDIIKELIEKRVNDSNITEIDESEKEILVNNLVNFIKSYDDISTFIISAFLNPTENNFFIIIANYSLIKENFIIDFLKLLKDNRTMSLLLMKIIPDKTLISFCNYTYNHPEDVVLLYNIMVNDENIKKLVPLLLSKMDNNKEELIFELFTNKDILQYPDLITIFVSIGLGFVQDGLSAEGYVDALTELARGAARAFQYNNYDIMKEDLTPECFSFINSTIFENKNQSKFFIYKSLIDTSKSPNDLLNYDNCLKKPPIVTNINIENIEKEGAVPAFVFATMDNSIGENKNKYKIGTQLEECYFVASICLPQGINNGNQQTYDHCTNKDYSHILRYIFNLFTDISETQINAIAIKRNAKITEKISGWKIAFAKFIPFYIILVPSILYIILSFCKKKKYKPIKKEEHSESLIDDRDNKEQKDRNIRELRNRQNKPRWVIYLDEFFNFSKNGKELFNFESKITICNNTNGLKYIVGLIGFSILLTILGQIYLILYNLPMKNFGKQNFYFLINNFFYIFFFIGLRYSPRILFSCSGYILSFKYLCFIEKDSNLFFIKLFSRHFYKYIILVLIILFGRHSYYPLITVLFGIQPINELFNENVLSVPKKSSHFFLSLLTFKSFQINKVDTRVKHYLTDFFWMPINEIFFFIIGTILISLGYKYKLRIDYFIIILVILLYSFKIIFYYAYYYGKEEIYTTLYYYMFDYGDLMLSPLFNLSYYLIGMFFGLINYTIEKGVTSLYRENMYQFIHNEKNNEIINKEDEEKEEIVSRITTFKDESSFQLEELDDEENKINNQPRKHRISLGHKEIKNIKDSIINNKKENKEENKDINNKNEATQELSKEINSMPFLISPVIIKNWHAQRTENRYFFYILVILFSLIIIFFIVIHYYIIYYYKKEIYKTHDEEMKKIFIKLSLDKVICNNFLNFIYLIDIELVVLFVQWGFIILLLKQHFIIEFFNHIYWTFFNKFYFSLLLSCNSIILYIFYESETVVKLNSFNLWLYYFISTVFIFIVAIIIYIVLDSPLKKISKYLFSNNYKINFGEQLIDNNKEENKDASDNTSNDEEEEDEDE